MPNQYTGTDRLARFWEMVDKTESCWNWKGCKIEGYGVTLYEGKMWRVHRLAYELLVGPIPAGLTIDHLCRNRRCVNPEHLDPVSSAENTRRGEGITARLARATHCMRGHEFNEANTHKATNGQRECRTCRREQARARRGSTVEVNPVCLYCSNPFNRKRCDMKYCSKKCKSDARHSRNRNANVTTGASTKVSASGYKGI